MTKIKLANVRCSYPSLFQKATFEGKETPYYTCTFIIPKDRKSDILKIENAIENAMKKAGVKKLPKLAKICFQDGDETDYPELQGCYSLKAKTKKRPTVIHNAANGNVSLSYEDGVIYAGCYVNAIISADFYCYTKNSGGITSTLLGVQFCRNGESFEGGVAMATEEDFDDFVDFDDEIEEL
jgi:hypothetical protein